MKALVLKDYNRFLWTDAPRPSVGPADVLIRVKACGICGSDVHGMDGSTGRRQPPVIMGHEAAGVIESTGENAGSWKPGDRVTFDSTVYCGQCHFCQSGKINLCDNRRVLGVSCDEYRCDGAFAEYVAVPHHILYRLPDTLSFEHAAMTEAVSIAVHAVGRTCIPPQSTVLVAGTGLIGLLIVQALRVHGCIHIIASDINEDRLQLARRFGAEETVRADAPDAAGRISRLTAGAGADVAFEVVGITPVIRLALEGLRKGGELVLVGNLSPAVELPLQQVVTREISISGSCASAGEYPRCLDMISENKVDVGSLISAAAPMAEGAQWFQRLYEREKGLMKVVLLPE